MSHSHMSTTSSGDEVRGQFYFCVCVHKVPRHMMSRVHEVDVRVSYHVTPTITLQLSSSQIIIIHLMHIVVSLARPGSSPETRTWVGKNTNVMTKRVSRSKIQNIIYYVINFQYFKSEMQINKNNNILQGGIWRWETWNIKVALGVWTSTPRLLRCSRADEKH